MTPLVRHFLMRISLQRALMAGAAGAVLLSLHSESNPWSLGGIQSFIWVLVLLIAYLGLYPLSTNEWVLPLPRRRLFDAAAWAYLIAGQLATLPPLLIWLSKSTSSPGVAIAHALSLQTLTALFQVLAVVTLPFWRAHLSFGQLAALLLLFGSFGGGALGLAFAPGLVAGLLAPGFLLITVGVWRLGRGLYARYEPAVGLGILHAARGLAGGRLAQLPASSWRGRWPDLVGSLPPRWRYLTRSIYNTLLYVAAVSYALVGPVAITTGTHVVGIMAILAGASLVNLVASRLPYLASFSRGALHGAVFLPLLGLSLLGGSVPLAIYAASEEQAEARGAPVLILLIPFAFLIGAGSWLPSRRALRRNGGLRTGSVVTFLTFAGFLLEGARLFSHLGDLSTWRLEETRALHTFLSEHAAFLGPVLLAACILLYVRNQRACRWLEYRPSPFQRAEP